MSQLKKAIGSNHKVIPILLSDFALHIALEQVLESSTVLRGPNQVQQVLVKWNNLPAALATWEDYEAMRQEYPRAAAWGQAAFQGRGNVRKLPRHVLHQTNEDGRSDDGAMEEEGRPKTCRPSKKKSGISFSIVTFFMGLINRLF